MSAYIEVEGIEDIIELMQDMVVTEEEEKKAMKKAVNPIAEEVEKNSPVRTGKLQKSVVKSVKKEGFAIVGIIRMGRFYDIFQEFGTSRDKKHVGFFEKSVNASQDEAVAILGKELLK